MNSTDPIADMLTRIRNAVAVRKNEVSMPHSKMKQKVAEVLKSNNFVENVEVSGENGFKTLKITINRVDNNARITEVERLSKPGRRLYSPAQKIPTVKNGRGIVVISTSKGVMSGLEAEKPALAAN